MKQETLTQKVVTNKVREAPTCQHLAPDIFVPGLLTNSHGQPVKLSVSCIKMVSSPKFTEQGTLSSDVEFVNIATLDLSWEAAEGLVRNLSNLLREASDGAD